MHIHEEHSVWDGKAIKMWHISKLWVLGVGFSSLDQLCMAGPALSMLGFSELLKHIETRYGIVGSFGRWKEQCFSNWAGLLSSACFLLFFLFLLFAAFCWPFWCLYSTPYLVSHFSHLIFGMFLRRSWFVQGAALPQNHPFLYVFLVPLLQGPPTIYQDLFFFGWPYFIHPSNFIWTCFTLVLAFLCCWWFPLRYGSHRWELPCFEEVAETDPKPSTCHFELPNLPSKAALFVHHFSTVFSHIWRKTIIPMSSPVLIGKPQQCFGRIHSGLLVRNVWNSMGTIRHRVAKKPYHPERACNYFCHKLIELCLGFYCLIPRCLAWNDRRYGGKNCCGAKTRNEWKSLLDVVSCALFL